MASKRGILFIDGSNFYHAARDIGVATSELDYQALAHKLVLDRVCAGIRYYVGAVSGDLSRIAAQGKFLDNIRAQGVQVTLGRIERRMLAPDKNPVIVKLKELIEDYHADLREPFLGKLEELCQTRSPQYTENRVDVSIAVDMIMMAYEDAYDVAYLLSADGDYVPAVEAVKSKGKKVFAASPATGRELKNAVDTFIPLRREVFRFAFVDARYPRLANVRNG